MWQRQTFHPDTLFWHSSGYAPRKLQLRPIGDAKSGDVLEYCPRKDLFSALLCWWRLGFRTTYCFRKEE